MLAGVGALATGLVTLHAVTSSISGMLKVEGAEDILIADVPPNGARSSCGALKKDSFSVYARRQRASVP